MEKLGKILKETLDSQRDTTNTQNRMSYLDDEKEMTLEEKREQLRKSLNISSLDNTFENFQAVPGSENALRATKELSTGLTEWKMLMIYGGIGNGKTHLCESLSIELYKKGIFCRIMNMSRMMRALKNTFSPYSIDRFEEIMNYYCKAERLIVDDIGVSGSDKEFKTDIAYLEQVVLERYRENLFTVLTTNINLPDMEKLFPRIVSRFRDKSKARLILNKAPDYRLRK